MKNSRLEAGRALLLNMGVSLTDEQIMELFYVMAAKHPVEYEMGDFIVFLEGLGELGFGTVQSFKGEFYSVDRWCGDETATPITVSVSDVLRIETKESAAQYERVRGTRVSDDD